LPRTGGSALAQKKYDTGATDTEIKVGNIMPYSGPASAYGVIGKTEEAYFKKINAEGGINGRKINFISYDDGYSPPKAVEQARKLVESDEVLVVFNPLGTPSNTAIQKYPQRQEGPAIVRRHRRHQVERSEGLSLDHGLAAQLPERSAHLRQIPDEGNAGCQGSRSCIRTTDFGKDYLKGLKDGLGAKASMLIAEEKLRDCGRADDRQSHRQAQGDGADVFINIATPKFAAQAIKKIAEGRLEGHAYRHQRLGIRRRRDQAGGI